MKLTVLLLKVASLFALVGAAVAAVTSYIIEHWGTNQQMLQSLVDSHARPIAAPMILGYVLFAFIFSLPAAFLTGILFAIILIAVNRIAWRSTAPVVAGIGACTALIVAVPYQFWYGSFGAPIYSGVIAAVACSLLCGRLFSRWLTP